MTTAEKKAEQAIQDESVKEAKKATSDFFADFDLGELKMSMEEMLKAGVHFGHNKARKDPRMEEYIYGTKKGVNIINLQATQENLERALAFIENIKKSGKKILFIGTKKQSRDLVKSAAKRCQMPYVIERWLGGTFTNFSNIKKRTRYLKDLEAQIESGELKKYTKFEQSKKKEEAEKLERRMGGIKEMVELPAAIFATDVNEDNLAIREAIKMNIPVVALVDTNVNPVQANYPIPSNDDAVSSLKLMLGYVCRVLEK
ncbi:MAG: 30S ribosomal protein S2 [Candidatus Moranbacteria bacterium]|jgi:small subunit ribosomal protein S2|nr:30S ribosomal protein S2 [Candidatus Moranbacteria bacterium]